MRALLFCVLILAAIAGCKEPTEALIPLMLRAVSADSSHIDVGFPQTLDPVRMEDPANVSVTGARVHAVSVIDSVRGRSIRITTDPIPDGVRIRISIGSIRLLTGTTLGRGPIDTETVTGLSYSKDIAPLFAERCNRCHSGPEPAGSYSTDGYFSLYGNGTHDRPNLLPPDSASVLVRKCLPTGSMFWTGGLEFNEAEMIRNWVVNYAARP